MTNTNSKGEGIRYIRLNQVFNKALSQSILKFQNQEKINSCFPKYSKTRLGKVHLMNCQKQVSEFWTELSHREFEEILKDRDVKNKLNELDALINFAKERLQEKEQYHQEDDNKQVSVTDLSAEQFINCSLYSQRVRASKDLDSRLETINELNRNLEQELKELEKELNTEIDDLENIKRTYLGHVANQPPDRELAQGLNDMLIELQENY
ncbi:hypothetical protein KAFR_0G00810 [Kazachstania africana CBS 2517]|uniref:Kinetochore-associated protein n=1 Tax=Kazachstania africana (strain ATCC 22294 / BCRC 22015 / CBS 2517 / CECT 1963 / NBRC 1671 / NRRL Y-8276) TaxID=1071382 RepID=H2AXL4_KAZAF|nr:hypothetical protein KAFR_0G00810 [Kazachstania africana CBS 2517]CCF59114.1 hypothetical protein KAFR_0G00810 [Kazachstania africana CBS 2517]